MEDGFQVNSHSEAKVFQSQTTQVFGPDASYNNLWKNSKLMKNNM